MEYAELFSYLANITSVIAFLFAGYQFFQWRRQQRHSLELESILNMEDRFELLVASNMKVVKNFQKAKEIVKESSDKPIEEKNKIDLWLKMEFFESVKSAQHRANECAESYSLACFKAKRLGFDVASTDELQCGWIVEKFSSFISSDISTEEITSEVSAIKQKAGEKFAALRKI
ncbi:MAG: hypothetical protein DU481_01450 [Nitrosomonas sp.]|uniref:hypothetical protein n=1 Tax=Nitrosomonas sp. TaxID=42353 RepID=UPI0032EF1506